jgi:hypothetical protein
MTKTNKNKQTKQTNKHQTTTTNPENTVISM